MKHFLAITLFLFHFFAAVSFAEAKLPFASPQEKAVEKSEVSTLPLHQDYAADITHTWHFHCASFKVRDHRSLPVLTSDDGFYTEPQLRFSETFTDHLSLSFLALRKLLLFPKHYFL